MRFLAAMRMIRERGGDVVPPPQYSLATRIFALVLLRHGISRAEFKRRHQRVQPCKRSAVSALRTLGLSTPETAGIIGLEDHSSVLHHEYRCTAEDHLRAFEAICDAMGEPA